MTTRILHDTPVDHPTAGQAGHRVRTLARTAPVLAACVAVVVWLPLHVLADLEVRQGGGTQRVGAVAMLVSALVAGLGALGVAGLAGRVARRPRRTFLVSALVVLALSLLGPVGSATTAGAALALALLHVVVAGTVVPLVARSLPHAR